MQNLGSVNRKFWYDISVYLKTVYYTDLRVFLYGPQITPISNASKLGKNGPGGFCTPVYTPQSVNV